MRSNRKILSIGAVIAVAAAGAAAGVAMAQTVPAPHSMAAGPMQEMMGSGHSPMGPGHMPEMMHRHQGMMSTGTPRAMPRAIQEASTTPTLPGQDAFGAIQEIVHMLDADPNTDWSKVDLEMLRQHLIDMNEVTLRADAAPTQIDGGLEIAVTGGGRTLTAIRRMIPAWVQMANGNAGWTAAAAELRNGELVTVTAADPKEVQRIRGLGFIGLLASGSWHQPHHLAMAKGEFDHRLMTHER